MSPPNFVTPPDDNLPPFDFTVLRDLRKRADLTIGQVSEQSRVSTAVISKLERNLASAELETLHRLARVFGLTASDLLGLAESRTSHATSAVTYASGDFNFERIDYGNARCFHARAKAGSQLHRPDVHHDDHEICWVLEGSLKIEIPHERHVLKTGDALQFDAVQEHTYETLENTEFLLIHVRKPHRY
jgi:transcriptional regulator with XRE-family HTH domain